MYILYMITDETPSILPILHLQVFLRIRSEEGERKIEKLINETGRMEEIYKVEDAQKFIQQNVVVYFFDRYMRVDSKLLQSCR